MNRQEGWAYNISFYFISFLVRKALNIPEELGKWEICRSLIKQHISIVWTCLHNCITF